MRKLKILVNLKTYQRRWRLNGIFIRKFINNLWETVIRTPRLPRPILGKISPKEIGDLEITVVFLNNSQIKDYNHRYRKKNYPTDVLSFPSNETTLENRYYLGDILISIEKAVDQAKEKGHSLNRELKILILHGILHLLGYDHESDSGQMDHLESRLQKILL